ncbi:MAG: hypothetical protein A2W11_00720 [Ignavibacteria bacterium RBG_16_35_7]|nr:MAG: hypothetical protein A2W11_00720 [Ignavibacteria bacterium RBG_16_35_7]
MNDDKLKLEQDKDFQNRRTNFFKEFKELSKKHQVDISAYLDFKIDGIFPKLILINIKETKNE